MARVTEPEVAAIIQTDKTLSLAPFIATATALTDHVSAQDSNSVLTDALLVEIEKYLAAHFYAHRDQQYMEKTTGDARAKFQVAVEVGLASTQWGRTAVDLDVSGTLASLKDQNRASMSWLGKTKTEQIDYVDRD